MLSKCSFEIRDSVAEAMEDLDRAIRKRDLLVRSIQRVCTNIENMVQESGEVLCELQAAKIDKEDLEKKMAEFHEVQSRIEIEVEDAKLGEHENERTRVETIARSARIVLADFIAASTEVASANASLRRSASFEPRAERKMKRPEIQLPKFEGDYRRWNDFKNVFESLVVNEEAYTNVEKMVYLKQATSGSAADVIRKFDITERNFEKAWEKLARRYENRRATINTHLQALTQLPLAKSEAGLQKLVDAASDAIESLEAMDVKQPWSYMVSFLVTEKLDPETRKAWEMETVKDVEYPTYEKLESFLHQRVRALESMGSCSSKAVVSKPKQPETAKSFQTRKAPLPSANSDSVTEVKCFDCNGNHVLTDCETFAARSIAEKTEIIKKKGLCFQCLRKGHMVLACRAPRCSKCSKRHHILLHVDSEKPVEKIVNTEKSDAKKVYCNFENSKPVFLPSAIVKVGQSGIRKLEARTLLDSCSEVNLITESLVRRLKCSLSKSNVVIETLSPGNIDVTSCCKLSIASRFGSYEIEVEFQIVPAVSSKFLVYDASRFYGRDLNYADEPGLGSDKVELLIGAEFFESVMMPGKRKLDGQPFLRETTFGWVALGSQGKNVGAFGEPRKCFFAVQDSLVQFFEVEEVGTEIVAWTQEERECAEHFERTFVHDEAGFEVELPKEYFVDFLGESRHIAFKQFCALERRLTAEEKIVYRGFMNEYADLGHMTLVRNPELSVGRRCYLPHHAVYKKTSTTSRMRSVFNASSPTTTGFSLNDVLKKGPVLQEDLFSITLRFRCHKYAFTADIEKMYRQVRVKPQDRKLQCILWRDSPDEPIRTYELNTVTYGTKPASYLATKCLSKLAEESEKDFPETAVILKRDFYMDDVLTGDSSVKKVRRRLQELHQVLGKSGFPLRKFASNSKGVLVGLDKELIEGALEFEKGEQSVGVLGMRWLTAEDSFVFYARLPESPTRWTKREVLSEVSKIFDPMGLLSPITISLKILVQSLWADQRGWDDEIPSEVASNYVKIREKLVELPLLRFPRFVGEVEHCEYHVFSDASEKAYGAVIYARCINGEEVTTRVLCAKTRVAPLKKVSLPRLELCGAVLAAKLVKKVIQSLRLSTEAKLYAWTDSTIVLSWLAKPEHPWCTFVANRVTKICEVLPSESWNHVKSQENAADVISRGIEHADSGDMRSFMTGPEFLKEFTPKHVSFEIDSAAFDEEKRKAKSLPISNKDSWLSDLISRVSSYDKLCTVTAFVLRFIENCVLPNDLRNTGGLSLQEHHRARNCLIKYSQTLIDNKKLGRIDHFVDDVGLIRLRSRLCNAPTSESMKFPLILPKCRFLNLYIEHLHLRFFHANGLFLKNFVKLEFHVMSNLSRLIRSTVYKCVTCRRHLPNLGFEVPVGQLPAVRVNASPAFVEVGVDFAGPFTIRAMGPSGNRGRVFLKAYVSVFVCMSTKACHLEVVEDLSSKCFLDAFSRFVSRRGLCARVFSDHGTNFVGAERELRTAFELLRDSKDEIEKFAVKSGIEWSFIPQRAPNFGGLWEAAVKSFKSHFLKVIGAQILSYSELVTLVTQIEAVLNSRPLCPSDSVSESFLSPGHLCIGRPVSSVPALPGEVVSGTHLTRYRLLRGIFERFWSIWHREYLLSLRKSTVKLSENRSPVVGELVFVLDENSAPGSWPLARITKLFYGKDNVARVADVRIGSKIFRRPLIKLVPMFSEPSVAQGAGVC